MTETLGCSRQDFIETWLTEMPRGIDGIQLFEAIREAIMERIDYGFSVIDLGNNLKKIMGKQIIHYWYEKDNEISLCAELEIKPQGYVVNALAKNPTMDGSPYASDLYINILKDSNKAIKLYSDKDMTRSGLNVWKRLLSLGYAISVYDNENPGQSLTTLSSETDLDRYFKMSDYDFQRYRFVLTEAKGVSLMLAETRGFFHTRRMRELASIQSNHDLCE